MEGFSINVETFDLNKVIMKKPEAAAVPDGFGTATQINIMYNKSDNDDEVTEIPLIFDGPEMRSAKTKQGTGILPPQASSNGKPGSPSIAVVFNLHGNKFNTVPNQEHIIFVGEKGNKHEYYEDEDAIKRVHPDYTPATGFICGIWEKSVDAVAEFLHSQKKGGKAGSTPSLATYQKAVDMLPFDKRAIFQRSYTEGELKGQIIPDSNPMKYFKLLNYAAGTPDENLCKFYLPDGKRIPNKMLYNKPFTFKPVFKVRRLFLGMQNSIQIEINSALVVDIHDDVAMIPAGTARLLKAEQAQNPERAREVAEKFKKLMGGTGNGDADEGVKVDSIDTSVIDGDKPLVKLSESPDQVQADDSEEDVPKDDSEKPSRRPGLPSSLRKKIKD